MQGASSAGCVDVSWPSHWTTSSTTLSCTHWPSLEDISFILFMKSAHLRCLGKRERGYPEFTTSVMETPPATYWSFNSFWNRLSRVFYNMVNLFFFRDKDVICSNFLFSSHGSRIQSKQFLSRADQYDFVCPLATDAVLLSSLSNLREIHTWFS